MIKIVVDYQGERSIERYEFLTFNEDYLKKLDEIEKYQGKIDSIQVYDTDKGVKLVDHTNVGVALRRARQYAKRYF